MAMTHRGRAGIAIVLGVVCLALVVPYWWELLTADQADRDGHTVLGFYLPITAIFGVPGGLLLTLGVLVLRREERP